MKLKILGTGNASVTKCYNTCFAFEKNGEHFLVDGGGGNTILERLEKANIGFDSINTVFITHKHIDHLLGIIWVIRIAAQSILAGKAKGSINIYGHDEVIELTRNLCKSLLQKKQYDMLGDKIHLICVKDKESIQVMGYKCTFFDILSTKAKQYGFTLYYEDKKLTCCGDEPYNECEYEYAVNSEWMLHEAFCLHSQADIFKPYEKNHSTVKDACILAEDLGVKNLILYHTEDKNIDKREELYKEEGSKYYRGNLYVPYDMTEFEL